MTSKFLRRALGLALGRRLPRVRGELTVPGLSGPVTIRRDRWGIPHIAARDDRDAFFALGFCHGQDRSFQLEMQLRAVRGTLAALVGRRALAFDRLSRRVGFHRAALRQIAVLEPGLRSAVEAYASGVNRGTRLGAHGRAHELVLLRARPSEFTAADVRAYLNLMSFALAANWDSELTRLRVLESDGPEALRALNPTYPEWLPVASPPGARAGAAADRLAEDLERFFELTGLGGGSNNWALAPGRTASGRAIVASDPHLPPTVPSPWYLATVRTPDWTVAGASFVGTPSFPVAHNEHGAWGLTAGLVDNTDLFLEELAEEGRSVRSAEGWVPCEVIEERIEVRGSETVVERISVTPRGPIISPALAGEKRAISIRATWLDELPVGGYLLCHRSRSFEEFRQTFAAWPVLAASMVYADRDGTVGWLLAGEAPRRRAGFGLVPLPGWSAGAGWEETGVPFDEMPGIRDPETGFVASANQLPAREGDGPFLGADWIDGYRMARICEALSARRDWDVERCQRLQLDRRSLPWGELKEAVVRAPVSDPAGRRALELLRSWDGDVGDASVEATIFELLLLELVRRCVRSKAPRSASWMLGRGASPVVHRGVLSVRRTGHLSRLIREAPAGWFPRSWPEEIADALSSVARELEDRLGPDPARWAWGRIRKLWYRHPFGENRLLGRIFNLGPLPGGGDSNTILQAAVDPFEPTANPLFVPSLRAVFDVGSWSGCRLSIPGGQSGNPASPHYDDQLPLFARGEGVALPWSRQEVEAAQRAVLTLVPGAGRDR